VDDAMTAIAGDNPALDKTRLGRVVDRVSNIKVGGAETQAGQGDR
jgi:hypothetical protein